MLLDRVIDSCSQAMKFISGRNNADAMVAVLTPHGDPIVREFGGRCEVFEGDEFDVLSRYVNAAKHYNADYVIRITGDCPLSLAYVIEGAAKIGLRSHYDYVSNCDERFRTSIDGLDCEFISTKLLNWAGDNAKTAYDREHVTPIIRRESPSWANLGVIINHLDLSHIKLSVDTQEDYERACEAFSSALSKYQQALRSYGHGKVHRL